MRNHDNWHIKAGAQPATMFIRHDCNGTTADCLLSEVRAVLSVTREGEEHITGMYSSGVNREAGEKNRGPLAKDDAKLGLHRYLPA
jgi:hypothetical protein